MLTVRQVTLAPNRAAPFPIHESLGGAEHSYQRRPSVDKDVGASIDEWVVKAIIGEECIDGIKYYRVDWEDTLEPAENFTDWGNVLQDWETEMAQRQRFVDNQVVAANQRKRKESESRETIEAPARKISKSKRGDVFETRGFTILDSREHKGKIEYKLGWESNWQPAMDLRDHVDEIELFHQNSPNRPGPPRWVVAADMMSGSAGGSRDS